MSEREPLSEDQQPFASADDSDSVLAVTLFTVMAIMAAFSTYFCMYAFRKPFSAATYEGLKFLNTSFDLKTVLVTSQIIGYALSKMIGIKFISEVTRRSRFRMLVGMILAAQAALFAFAVLPPSLKVMAIFFNGLPLGMVWGLVAVSYTHLTLPTILLV